MARRIARLRRTGRTRWIAGTIATLALTAAALAGAGVVPSSAPVRGATGTAWKRVFADDFRRGISRKRWGFYSGQPGGDPGGFWAPSHVVVRHGVLNLETYRDARFGGRWVSGGVSSAPALKQTYGRYLVRFRMDAGKGVAGVLLLFPSGGGWPPEIDFAEDGGATSRRDHQAATLHYSSDDRIIQRGVRANFTRWHVMGVEWTPGKLVYTLDGRRWAAVRSSHVPAQRMELDMQAQAGTCGERDSPCPDPTTPPHVNLQIDWVHAYAYRPAG